jgi:hypothetical protein
VDIAAWLRQLGLERYEQAFRQNEIDAEVLAKRSAAVGADVLARAGRRRRGRPCKTCGGTGRIVDLPQP